MLFTTQIKTLNLKNRRGFPDPQLKVVCRLVAKHSEFWKYE